MVPWRSSRRSPLSPSPSPPHPLPPLPPMLPLLSLLTLLLLLTSPALGCMSTVLQGGTLPDTELLLPESQVATSCSCCALCHHVSGCASLSFSKTTGACRLYGSVPDFRRLQVDTESELFVRPGRSEHHQFCRHDSDCVERDERCHGRICTTDPTVTCRDLSETYGAPGQSTFYGSINGTTMKIYCKTDRGIAGWTLIGFFKNGGSGWDRSNILERNVDSPSSEYSILGLTDVLRRAGAGPRFQIHVLGRSAVTGLYGGFTGSLPVDQSLIVRSDSAAAAADLVIEDDVNDYVAKKKEDGLFRMPWLPGAGAALLSVRRSQDSSKYFETMANTANVPYLDGRYHYVQYFIRE